MEPQITAQSEQNNTNINTTHTDKDLCPVHDTELTDGFCEYCQVCYSCK